MFGTEFRMLQEVQPAVAEQLEQTMSRRRAELDERQQGDADS
jgi:hypothetical protein